MPMLLYDFVLIIQSDQLISLTLGEKPRAIWPASPKVTKLHSYVKTADQFALCDDS
ncbi:hypothetical protein [Vibrio xiamenensis]|uniref:hypothetical protein n=1 Tax=Vibrio xiamenensis TaxID=861298 RepID=UPI0015A4DB54|nr:hypothetical protein [Vibrio xiamenensis]